MPAPAASIGDRSVADRLAAWLVARLAEDADGPITDVAVEHLHRPGVGQSSDTILFRASWTARSRSHGGDFVLRLQPPAEGIFLHPDAVREFRVLDGLRTHPTVPSPRVRWSEPDPGVLGAPFFVMDQVSGIVPSGKPSIHAVGWLPTLEPDQRRQLAASAIACVAALHAADWRGTHDFLRRDRESEPDLAAHLEHTVEWHRWTTQGRPFEIVDAALTHVLDQAGSVTQREPVLLWGDARLGNTMFDPQTLQVNALLDWEIASIGPRGIDVAHWLVFDEFATSASGFDRLPGYPDRRGILEMYEASSGSTLADVEYFEILECLFLAITLIRQADAAVRSGRLEPDTRMGHENTLTQMLARRLGLPVPELAADYLKHRRPAQPAASPQPG